MKKTTFHNMEFSVSTMQGRTYREMLDENEIKYSIRSVAMFQPLLPREVLDYSGYEIIHMDENGDEIYAYSFVREMANTTNCITFLSETRLNNLEILDLEQAQRIGTLTYKRGNDSMNKFGGFDLAHNMDIHNLVDTYVDLGDGSVYEFEKYEEFPEGISGKRFFSNGAVINILLIKMNTEEPVLAVNEYGSGWIMYSGDKLAEIFGNK